MGFFRPTFAEINLGAVEENFNSAKTFLPENSGILAMVKADAYGHGAVKIAKRLEKSGAAGFGVATVEEGLELKNGGIRAPIIVMGGLMGMGPAAAGMMVESGLVPVVHSSRVLELLEAACRSAGKKIRIHLKIDTGMSRLGLLPSGLPHFFNIFGTCRHLQLAGVMTHFAEAEDEEYTEFQKKNFRSAYEQVKKAVGNIEVVHVANSAALIDKNYITENGSQIWVRPGLMLYGSYPAEKYRDAISLKPAMSIKSSLALIKSVPEGTKVSYSCTYTTTRKTRLGIIPMGYADGYPWSLSNKSRVLVQGKRAPVVGRVTMDMIVVDVTDIDAHVGDEVVLLGKQGNEEISAEELSALAGTISYEFFCGISKRMPRIYVD